MRPLLCVCECSCSIRHAKARLKQLYKGEPLEYIQLLPAAPVEYLQQYRPMALQMFSREHPPVACPLNDAAVDMIRSKINMRPRASKAGSAVSIVTGAGGQAMVPFSMLDGLPMHMHMPMHILHLLVLAVTTALSVASSVDCIRFCLHSLTPLPLIRQDCLLLRAVLQCARWKLLDQSSRILERQKLPPPAVAALSSKSLPQRRFLRVPCRMRLLQRSRRRLLQVSCLLQRSCRRLLQRSRHSFHPPRKHQVMRRS